MQSSVVKLFWQYQGGRVRIKSAEMSPAKREVILTCEIEPPPAPKEPSKSKNLTAEEGFGLALAMVALGPKQEKPLVATLWMAKDTGGRWVIRFIRARVRKEGGS
jgi:hypothetical protein